MHHLIPFSIEILLKVHFSQINFFFYVVSIWIGITNQLFGCFLGKFYKLLLELFCSWSYVQKTNSYKYLIFKKSCTIFFHFN